MAVWLPAPATARALVTSFIAWPARTAPRSSFRKLQKGPDFDMMWPRSEVPRGPEFRRAAVMHERA
eukprot:342668-Alexandrium_andersonii.AAC.1